MFGKILSLMMFYNVIKYPFFDPVQEMTNSKKIKG